MIDAHVFFGLNVAWWCRVPMFLSGDARTVLANWHRAIQCSFVRLPTSWTLGRCIGAPPRHAQAGAQESWEKKCGKRCSIIFPSMGSQDLSMILEVQLVFYVPNDLSSSRYYWYYFLLCRIYCTQRWSERRSLRSETADLISYTTVINTCADVGQWAHALKIHSSMIQGLGERSCEGPA